MQRTETKKAVGNFTNNRKPAYGQFSYPGKIEKSTRDAIFGYLQENPALQQLNAGDYYTHNGDFKLHFPLQWHGILQQRLKTGELDFITPLLQPDFVNRSFEEGFHIIPVKNRDGNITHTIGFHTTQRLAVRKDKYGNMVCDVISLNNKGGGSFGYVFPIKGSLKHRYHDTAGIKYEKGNKKRLVKIFAIGPSENTQSVDAVQSEKTLLQKTGLFGCRDVFSGRIITPAGIFTPAVRKNISGFSIRYIPEQDLFDILSDPSYILETDIADRFKITLSYFKSIKKYVHDLDLVHRDLKSENVRVQHSGPYWNTTILDYGLAREDNKNDYKWCGSRHYVPKEMIKASHQDKKVDIFTAGIITGLIWNDQHQAKLLVDDDPIPKREEYQWSIPLDQLFCQIKQQIPSNIRLRITNILHNMLSADHKERPSIEQCIDWFEQVYEQYRNQQFKAEDLKKVIVARAIAKQACSLLNEYVAQPYTKDAAQQFLARFEKMMADLPDNAASINEFNTVFNCEWTYQSNSKLEIVAAIKNTIEGYHTSQQWIDNVHAQLTDLQSKIDPSHAEALSAEISKLEQFRINMRNKPFDLFKLPEETMHNVDKYQKQAQILQYFSNYVIKSNLAQCAL